MKSTLLTALAAALSLAAVSCDQSPEEKKPEAAAKTGGVTKGPTDVPYHESPEIRAAAEAAQAASVEDQKKAEALRNAAIEERERIMAEMKKAEEERIRNAVPGKPLLNLPPGTPTPPASSPR